ncbi:MAG: gliding motility-associated C-terminal domain-containing protein, partial [Bacteroidetes bacterium]
VNGTLYDAANPTGTEVIAGGSWLGCDSVVQVQLGFYPEAVGTLDTTLCAGEALVVNGTLYDEQHPQGTELIAGGSWTGCDSTVQVSLSFHPPALAQITMLIPADSSIVVNGTVYDAANPSGTEVIEGGSWTGCDSTIVVSLSFLDFEIFAKAISPTCAGQFDGTIVIDSVKGAKFPLTLEFMGALIPLDGLPYALPGLGAGTYELAITDASGLTVTTTVALPDPPELYLDLGGTIEVFLGESVKLQPTVTGTPASWQWSPPDYLDCTDCPSPTAVMPLQTITYTAVVADTAGCTATDSVLVLVKKQRAVYVPNVFSPDGDGFNDRFYVQAGPEVARLRDFRIFDRWGNLVFQAAQMAPNDYGAGWDGTWKGQPAQQGVYVYTFVVEYLDGTTQRYRGDITLVR